MAYANDILKADGNLIDRIAVAFVNWRATRRENAAKYNIYRETLRELNSLSRRDMDDIGIRMGDIETIAYEAAYGK